ncbi:HEAT repeat-containing protein 3 [Condylostylus longicornis]|uniref:HEAT repeat-containing protein 3 n=1 Tax=Condylostylus longicornis TaxID=2530218 RepID=UPI00244E5039|nr:HEAT repeat-containing protein 3 [Condylostylus longicornis]
MGKTKKNRPHKKKNNPIGIPSVKEFEEFDDSDLESHSPIQAIIDGLQSGNDDKLNALQNLAVISLNMEKVKLICQSDIARIAAPLLFDPNDEVRNAAAGALRNLSVCSIEVCEFLVEQDVMTPLLALLSKYAANSWIPKFDPELKNQMDIKSDTFLQSVNLLWNLCESTSVALDNFNQTQLLNSFIRCLDYNIYGLEIAIGVAQCILVISEDNRNTWTILMEYFVPQAMNALNNLDEDFQHVMLRTVLAAILSNIPAVAAANSNLILTTLSKTLNFSHKEILNRISSTLPLEKKDDFSEINENFIEEETAAEANLRHRKMDLPSDIEIEIKNVGLLLEAQRIAAETISNLCSQEDEEWVDEDESDNEMVHDYDVSNHSSSTNLQNIDKIPVEILEAVKSLGLVEQLWLRVQTLADNVFHILRESAPNLLKKFKSLRISALLCLQNLCNCLSTEDLGGADAIYNVWVEIGQQVFQGPQDPLVLEPATSLMRSTLEHLKSRPDLFEKMTENDLQMILKGLHNCTMSEIRANWIRMLGILGCLLPEVLVKLIMAFILDTCQNEYDVWTISEGLDAFMDMFENNDWHNILQELNILQKTKEFERVLRNKMRQQKRDLKDRYPAVQTVRSNLQRFNKYLEKEMSKLS